MSESQQTHREKTGMKSIFSLGGLVLVLVILVLVNVVFSKISLRWDATSDKLYSLSDGSKKILNDLGEKVTIKVFFSQSNANIPVSIKNYTTRVIDFLREYEINGKGKISLEVFDPKPDSDEEEWAQKYGIDGVNLPTGEKIYFGLVALSTDQEEAIPRMDPSREEQLEYDITRIITRVETAEKKKIGVISGLPVFGAPPNYMNPANPQAGTPAWMFIQELKKTYEVKQIRDNADDIDNSLDLLLIIHPKGLSDQIQYAIDQYVVRGGKLIVYADPFSVLDRSGGQNRASDLDKLLRAWGVEMKSNQILVDFDYPTRLRTQNNRAEEDPTWISVRKEAFNKKDIITGKLESMLMPIAGSFKKMKDSKYEYEPMIQSSANSAMTDTFKIRFGTEGLRRDFSPTVEKYDLAVKIQGAFKSAFPNGKPEAKKDGEKTDIKPEKAKTEHVTQGTKKSVIILAADADMLSDNYYMVRQNFLGFNLSRIFNDNLNFLLNACEMLTGGDELISIRSRGKFEKPFTRVQELKKQAQERWMAREQELVKKVEDTNQKLRELEKEKDASQQVIISEKQEEEIRKFKEEKIRINRELKKVRRNLRADIESLGRWVKFINIFLMPMLVGIAGITYGLIRRKKASQSARSDNAS